jgi:hypothetical protein
MPSNSRNVLTLLGLAAAVGCDDKTPFQPPLNSERLHLSQRALSPFLKTEVRPDFDDAMARVADQVRGFAGVFPDEAGTMVAQLKDPTRLESRHGLGNLCTTATGTPCHGRDPRPLHLASHGPRK